jgi:hypothetical protein
MTPDCTHCGHAHQVEQCPDRCQLCGDLGADPSTDGVHLECGEADAAGADLPATEAERGEWRARREEARERYSEKHGARQ